MGRGRGRSMRSTRTSDRIEYDSRLLDHHALNMRYDIEKKGKPDNYHDQRYRKTEREERN